MKVRLVGDNIPNKMGIYTIQDARILASKLDLDLIKFSDNKDYPIYKILNYKKHLFEQKQKKRLVKKKVKNQITKEIRLRPNISQGDMTTKLNSCIKFFKKGFKLKLTMLFKGQELRNKDIGELKMYQFLDLLKDYYKPLTVPKFVGRKIDVNLMPIVK